LKFPFAQWDIVNLPIDFNDGKGPVHKYFVILEIKLQAVIALKTTSKPHRYPIGSDRRKCAVILAPNTHPTLFKETFIDPQNVLALDFNKIKDCVENGHLSVHPPSLNEIKVDLQKAIQNHPLLTPPRKKSLLAII